MPSPHGDWREALKIGRHPDPRLYSDREGAVWNFPGCRRGIVSAELTVMPGSAGIRISLADRWINPCDEFVREWAPFSFVLDGTGAVNGVLLLTPGEQNQLQMDFDLDRSSVVLAANGKTVTVPYSRTIPPPFGAEVNLSYLHLQTASETEDTAGVYLHNVHMKMS